MRGIRNSDICIRLQKEVKAEGVKFNGGKPKTIRFEELMEESEFRNIFEGKGLLIQPTPQNKPTSTVTIINFVRQFFHI